MQVSLWSLLIPLITPGLIFGYACNGSDDRARYDVSVTFNDKYKDDAAAAIETAIHSIDPDADVRLQESFPPVARATLRSRRTDVCETILAATAGRADVASATCDEVDSER